MDGNRFDALAKSIADLRSRRGFLRGVGIALGAGRSGRSRWTATAATPLTAALAEQFASRPWIAAPGHAPQTRPGRGRCACEAGTTPCAQNACCKPGQFCVNGVCRYPAPTATSTNTPTNTPTDTPTSTPTNTPTTRRCGLRGARLQRNTRDGGICNCGTCCTDTLNFMREQVDPQDPNAIFCCPNDDCCPFNGCCTDCFASCSGGRFNHVCARPEQLCPPMAHPHRRLLLQQRDLRPLRGERRPDASVRSAPATARSATRSAAAGRPAARTGPTAPAVAACRCRPRR